MMKYTKLNNLALVLLLLLLIMPFIGTMIMSYGSSAELKQYDALQLLVMGVYNLPFLAVSTFSLVVSLSLHKKLKQKAANIWSVISVCSSIAGSISMLVWALGPFS